MRKKFIFCEERTEDLYIIYLSFSTQNVKLKHGHFLAHHFQFIIHYQLIIQGYEA
jgi:hypothetical protein